jgi:hypothetical protein
MKHSERLAIYVIETINKGAEVEYQHSQSAGEYDVKLTYSDGSTVAVEVTNSTIQETQAMLAAIAERGCCVPARVCRNSWLVNALPGARIRLILESVDCYLSAIEAERIGEFVSGSDLVSPSVSKIGQDLGIAEGNVLEMPPPARIWVTGPSENGSIVTADDLQLAVEIEANKPDNKRKLAGSWCAERHLFVYVDLLNCGAWQAMLNDCIPEQPPKLPVEITHVWAAAESPDGIIVWASKSGKAWQNLGRIPSLALASNSKR